MTKVAAYWKPYLRALNRCADAVHKTAQATNITAACVDDTGDKASDTANAVKEYVKSKGRDDNGKELDAEKSYLQDVTGKVAQLPGG
ncbi:MAG: hypothetical protein WC455_24590 [Dehalococcoidia bacterium]|jgi:hypothetical protein